MKKFLNFRFGFFSHRSTGFGDEGGMERLKLTKYAFPFNKNDERPGPFTRPWKEQKNRVCKVQKNKKTLDYRNLIRLAAPRPRVFLSLWRAPRSDATFPAAGDAFTASKNRARMIENGF